MIYLFAEFPAVSQSFLKSIDSVVTQVGTHADLLGSRRTAILKAVDSRVQNLFLGEQYKHLFIVYYNFTLLHVYEQIFAI